MNERRTILIFCSSVHGYTHAVILALVPLLLLIRDAETGFDLSWRDSFLFAATSIFIYGFGGIPSGYLSDRFGSLKIILAGLIISMVSLIGIYLCTTSIQFLILISALGFGSSFYHPSGLSLISKVYTEQKGKAMGTHGFIGIFGQIAGPAASGVIGAFWGWRNAYLIWAFVGGAIILINLSLILAKIESKYLNNSSPRSTEAHKTLNLKFFLQTTILLILILTILRGWLYRGTVQVLPFYIEQIFSLDAETAAVRSGLYVTLMYIAGSVGQLIGGGLTDKYGFKKPMTLFGILAFVGLLFMLENWFTVDIGEIAGSAISFNSILLGVLIFGFAFFAGQPIVNALIAEITPERIRGSFYGFTFFTRFGLSAMALAFIAVFAAEQMLIAFYLIMIFTFVSIFVILAIDPNKDGG